LTVPHSPKPTTARANILHSVGGKVSYVLSQMLVLAALARFEGIEATGAFGFAMAVATPVFLLANMGLQVGLATDANRDFAFEDYVGLAIVAGILGLITCVTLGPMLLESDTARPLLVIIAAQKAVESLSMVCYGAFQLQSRMKLVARSLALRGWISAVIFALLLAAGAPAAGAFSAQLVVWSAVLIFHDYPLASRLLNARLALPRFHLQAMRALAVVNLPLSLSGFLNAIANNLPRLVLGSYFGLAAVGIYTVIAYFMQAGTMVINAVNQALLGHFAHIRLERANAAELIAITRPLLLAALCISLLGVILVYLLGEPALVAIFGAPFGAGFPLLMLISFALVTKLFGIVPQALIHADRRFKLFLTYELLSLGLGLVLLTQLVPRFGINGAGLSVLIVAVFRLLFLWVAAAPALLGKEN